MVIDNKLILKLENLARLELTEDERELIKGDLGNILDMVEKLQELETTDVDPLRYITEDFHPPREDIIASQDIREKALDLSPKRKGDFIAIPKVINK
jgi:aspartyl-tRNA(Asn)/glutamyl-tRNA(Gln) amidotransferase subunit C